MRLILSVIFLTFWRQTIAPVAKPCQILDSVRLYDASKYPQLCNEVNDMLEWAYFCDKFGMIESRVFCRVLGYPDSVSDGRISSNTLSSITKINNLDCIGNETLLTDCSFSETTQDCRVAKELECESCNVSSECLGGECLMNGTCACMETCLNGGHCFVGKCICPTGFGGVSCGQCSPPCQNGGTCSGNGTCECREMYNGTLCELSNTTGESENSTTISGTGQSTSNPTNPTGQLDSTLTLVLVGVLVPTTICSCTVIIICLATLVFSGFMIHKIKPFGMEKKENTNTPNNQTSTRSPHEYELDDLNSPNHEYYYIKNTQLVNQATNNSSAPIVNIRSEDGNYEIMNYQPMSSNGENNPDSTTNSSINLVDSTEQDSKYVINDLNDIL